MNIKETPRSQFYLNKAKILLVEDDPSLGETLKDYLNNRGYQCILASNGHLANQFFKDKKTFPNIVLMDIGLPDTSGLRLAREWLEHRKDFMLLFLSAQQDPTIRLQGLEMGGWDYITKPFALKELMIRLDRLLKSQRIDLTLPSEITHGKLSIFFNRFEVIDGLGTIISLSQKECAILKLLYLNRNKALHRDEIIDSIWGVDSFPSHRTVDNYRVKLRKWCDIDPAGLVKIIAIRGFGYKLLWENNNEYK